MTQRTQTGARFEFHFFQTTERGGMGREVGGMFKWKGTWVNLWLIDVDVW